MCKSQVTWGVEVVSLPVKSKRGEDWEAWRVRGVKSDRGGECVGWRVRGMESERDGEWEGWRVKKQPFLKLMLWGFGLIALQLLLLPVHRQIQAHSTERVTFGDHKLLWYTYLIPPNFPLSMAQYVKRKNTSTLLKPKRSNVFLQETSGSSSWWFWKLIRIKSYNPSKCDVTCQWLSPDTQQLFCH